MDNWAMRRRLLVLSEQTCPFETIENRYDRELTLANVWTQNNDDEGEMEGSSDRGVFLKPVLKCELDCSLSLGIRVIYATVPCLVRCKMHWGTTQNMINRPAEAQVVIQPSTNVPKKLMAVMALDPLASSARLSGGRGYVVTVTFKVYDMTVSRPPSGLGLYLNQARLEGNLCDVKLVLDGGLELDAHRTVLAARSPVLNKMLTGDFKEARESRVRLHLDHTPTAACQTAIAKFVEYVYTDEIADWENCELELLKLADMYMVPELRLDTELRLWSCDALRALEVLHAAGLGDFIGRKLRRRLTAIVVHNIADLTRDLAGSVLWNEFEKTYPALVDSMFSYAAKPSDGGCVLDWSF